MKYKINVDAEDIKNGIPSDCRACAISQALRRQFGTEETYTMISDETGKVCIEIDDRKFQVNDMQESDVIDFIHDFDNYAEDHFNNLDPEELKPISFEIIERSA